jgi:hypothetical protein
MIVFENMTEEQRQAFTDIAIQMYKDTEEAMNADQANIYK